MSQCSKQYVLSCIGRKEETDIFEHCYTFDCTPITDPPRVHELWSANGIINPCGSFIISVEQSCGNTNVYLNGKNTTGEEVVSLTAGQSIVISSDPLELIEIECQGTGGICKVTLCATINYECC